MKKPLIQQVNIKENFILFKGCYIDLGKIAFIKERQWNRSHIETDKYGGQVHVVHDNEWNFALRMFFLGSRETIAFSTADRSDCGEILIEDEEYDTFKAFLMKRLKPEQVKQ